MKLKLPFWKSVSDFVLYLIVLSLLTGVMKEEFYSYSVIGLVLGLIVNLIYIITKIKKGK